MMLHTNYQGFRPCGIRHEDYFMFPYISLCKTYDPRAEPFFNKLDRGPLGDATYQNIEALGLVVPDKKIFSCFPYISLC